MWRRIGPSPRPSSPSPSRRTRKGYGHERHSNLFTVPQVLFVAPERLFTEAFLAVAVAVPFTFACIDEACAGGRARAPVRVRECVCVCVCMRVCVCVSFPIGRCASPASGRTI